MLKYRSMEFRYRVKSEEPYNIPSGGVAIYGVSEDDYEYFRSYNNVDDMIKELQTVLDCAKDFKEKYARSDIK